MVNAQEWLDREYLNKKIEEIYINQQLVGELDLNGYDNLRKVYISYQVDKSKFEIKDGSYYDDYYEEECWREINIVKLVNAQEYLQEEYPTKEKREKETELYIKSWNLEGELDLSDFTDLWKLNCSDNYLTQIIYPTSSERLTKLNVKNNNFAKQNLSVFNRFKNLERLAIGNDDKNKISRGVYNRFVSSLGFLRNLSNLKELDISNTDLNQGVEYLPKSLEKIYYETETRSTCELIKIKEKLDRCYWVDIHKDFISNGKILKKNWIKQGFTKKQTRELFKEWSEIGIRPKDDEFIIWFTKSRNLDLIWAQENEEEFINLRDKHHLFGVCGECCQPATGIGYPNGWCQGCNARHFRDNFKNWTSGNHNIDKFIQKCQLEVVDEWNVIEWIPYEQFTDIEHIADGGFSKVYKAKWTKGPIFEWDDIREKWGRRKWKKNEVALKTLTNSQNLTKDFLPELMLYKRFKSEVSNMVPCYGVSRDEEGNYIMVMEYMKEGSLKQYLKENYQKLDFEDKLWGLNKIVIGLKGIHRKNLVHQDFHSGNIMVDDEHKRDWDGEEEIIYSITDLGLCRPADEEGEEEIFGVLPYVAPEVLNKEPYTQASDVYSLGMIMYEFITGYPPFCNEKHDTSLALKICQGTRPKFPKQVKYPQLLVDLIQRCWDSEPEQRPTTREVSKIMGEWFYDESESDGGLKINTEFYRQCEETEEHNKTLPDEIKYPNYQSFSEVVWHSKPINTKEIVQQLQQTAKQHGTKDLNLNLDVIEEQLGNLEVKEEQLQSHQEILPKK